VNKSSGVEATSGVRPEAAARSRVKRPVAIVHPRMILGGLE